LYLNSSVIQADDVHSVGKMHVHFCQAVELGPFHKVSESCAGGNLCLVLPHTCRKL